MNKSKDDILRAYEEDRQAREVYRYFQPANPAALNTQWPLPEEHFSSVDSLRTSFSAAEDSDSETTQIHSHTQSSPNTTLTSFAQLAALRLKAQRAFITILNHDFQFVLAEATKTTNIGNSKLSAEGDGLFVGTSTLTKSWNICQETITPSPDQQDGNHPFFVINDLEKEERFKELPFVTGEPRSRFYAGVPLTSGSDINLGCLFVLDSEPRDGLSLYEKDALSTVATLIMDYLQVSRQATEGRRALRLSHGLHLFVDGNSSFADMAPKSSSSCTSSDSSRSGSPPYQRTSCPASPRDVDSDKCDNWLEDNSASLKHGDRRPPSTHSDGRSEMDVPGRPTSSSHSQRQSDHTSTVSSGSKHWLFQRAANLLRQSLDLDGAGGVMFMGTSEDSSENFIDNHRGFDGLKSPAPILALSTRDDPLSSRTVSPEANPAVDLDHGFLNHLTRRYPKGRLWSFHHDGTLSTADEDLSVDLSRKQSKRFKASETASLNAYFPDACQVVFVPLWNGTDSQWFAGCFCWTPHPTRVFSRAVDLSSIFSFASSIMTEYSRVESVIADRQKGDFISSISHELRSPLHGVLAAAEFLEGTGLDSFQSTVVETINACGRTLLDTMNQVLDYSKIMSLERSKRRFKRGKDPWKPKSNDDAPGLDTLVSTDVAILTEDVVDSVALGHFHMKRSSAPTDHPAGVRPDANSHSTKEAKGIATDPEVELVVDIASNDWMYQVQPGSLRRLIMNLLGNSLKYTEKGSICVSLKSTEMSKSRSRRQGLQDMVTLIVSDTGKGISREYLQKRLYTPFAQENSLSVGTGLGLSIVRGIVTALNGKISIHSVVGEGTTVKVLLPFERPVGEQTPHSTLQDESFEKVQATPSSKLDKPSLRGKRAAIWAIDYASLGEHPFWSTIARYASDWYGLQLVSCSDKDIDIVFASEDDLPTERSQILPASFASLLIFSHHPSQNDPRVQWSHLASSLAFINGPCGPQKLARGIFCCLGSSQTSSNPTNNPADFVLPHRPKNPERVLQVEQDAAESKLNPEVPSAVKSVEASVGKAVSPSTSSSHQPTIAITNTEPRRPRILIVDDNKINLSLLSTYLQKRKITHLDKAEDGQTAVNMAEAMPGGYDIIFMDMSMPIMDGFEATRAIRAIENGRSASKNAQIIAFTGLTGPSHQSKAMEAGVSVFLTKPVSFKEVSRILSEWDDSG
ncbi:unnamed protein product [Penicillium salamii]|uniref:CheY-like superfamily n=1 Tax=Penicillium salamii TaxID=1612424 RepID=A0A9W4IR16_9EURO|nr:unnamed protein product [Penicillium salamii]CAG8207773.1 unnamed protein product [Penicillium salamii]CAG8327838.1 unnamed protein product [Penicillium salamii]CAG8330061.1 unnamed protein product [Penicillium salamii]CAG8343986.1 unnamed protein product [Penicillium salamii]